MQPNIQQPDWAQHTGTLVAVDFAGPLQPLIPEFSRQVVITGPAVYIPYPARVTYCLLIPSILPGHGIVPRH